MDYRLSTIDYLIVGQGLAGTMLGLELLKAGKRFLIVDEQATTTSSKIAAGMFNPISGKRMLKTWMGEELLRVALLRYCELEKLLGVKLVHQQNTYQIFGSVKEQNDLGLQLEKIDFAIHINLNPELKNNLKQPFGAFEISGSGWVNVNLMMNQFENLIINEGLILKENFESDLLKYEDNLWLYKNTKAHKIIFCQGYKNIFNPYFNWLPFVPSKGEVLTIKCSGISTKKIIKKGIYLVHLANNIYKVGATYEWDNLNENPSESGKNFLFEKLNEILNVPFEVMSHQANIRPSMRDRRPVLGEHPAHKNMFIFNGLGTKGVMLAPYFATELVEHTEHQKPLNKEVNLNRFMRFYEDSLKQK